MSKYIDQGKFTVMTAQLIMYAHSIGYVLTYSDAYATQPKDCPHCGGSIKGVHKDGSFHGKRLAVDFNLFIDGVYQTTTEAHRPLGLYWETLGGTWGGDFKKPDGNHYSYLE